VGLSPAALLGRLTADEMRALPGRQQPVPAKVDQRNELVGCTNSVRVLKDTRRRPLNLVVPKLIGPTPILMGPAGCSGSEELDLLGES
jgi:hypothetical protein